MSVYVYKYRCKNISVICIYTHVSVCLCVHAQQYGCISACLCVCVSMCVPIFIAVRLYVSMYEVYVCMHACMYLILFQCAYIYMCICVCICMYVHTHTLSGTASNAFTCHCSSKKLSQDHNMLTTGGKKIKRSQRLQEMGGKLQAEAGCRVHVHFDSVG